MADKKTYSVQFRRKRLGFTNYHKRLKLLTTDKPRLVVRKSNQHIAAQIISYEARGDKVLASAHSSELKKFKWLYGGNMSTAYLTGLLLGKRCQKAGIKEAILDIGMNMSVKGNKLYACLKGALDGKLNVPASPDVLPSADRISGKHIAQYAALLKKQGNTTLFSAYHKAGTSPESMPAEFEKVKKLILEQ